MAGDGEASSSAPRAAGADLTREIVAASGEGHHVFDHAFRYLYVNDAAARNIRKPREELLGRTLHEAHPGIEQHPLFAVLRKCLTQRISTRLEYERIDDAGRTTWLELRFQPIPSGLLVTSVDVTARKQTEHELQSAQRVLAVISEANQALVRAASESDFIRDVCRVVVERGGYRMAWVGRKEHDEERSVRPIAVAGADDGYTASMQLTWDEASPRGRGPTGRCVREGQAVVARFIASEPSFLPWRDEALGRGYASAIALPFTVDGEVEGAVSIYSAEPDAFDAHETRLLEELALDLGQGVAALRARSLSQQSAAQLAHLNARLHRLARVVQALSVVQDLASIVGLAGEAACMLTGAHGAVFRLRDGNTCIHIDEDPVAPHARARRVPIARCLGGSVMVARDTLLMEDAATDPRARDAVGVSAEVRGVAMVPIRRESPIGALGVYWRYPHRASEDDLGLLETLADSVAIAMESVRVLGELKSSEDRYRSLVENLDDLVFSVDVEGRFEYASQAAARYGYRAEEMIGQHFSGFVHDADLPDLQDALRRALTGSVEPLVFRARTKTGEERTVRSTIRAVMRDGKAVGVSGVVVDLTELKRTEEQLRAAQKMEAIGRLAGGVAHDFNNLLSVIMSYTAFVKDAAHDPQQREDIAEIEKAADRAAGLTRQLLAFSRRQVLEPRVLDLNQLTTDLEKMLQRLVGEDVELVKRLDPQLGKVRADPGQIEQVIMNLVVNARDAMPDGGTVTIETANVDLDESRIPDHPALKPGSYALLAISDTGCGMDEITKQRLFEPFYTTKELGKGTGLGLSTVYGIVEQSGGVIAFTSELGVGTIFKVYLPRSRVSPGSVRNRARSDRPSRGDETILLVEDEPTVRMLAERALEIAGYTVLTASNGQEALELFQQHRGHIDLLLTDVVMPQMNGRVLAQRLHELSPQLRVLFMSGYTDNVIERHGVLEHGMRFISKPFNGTTLTSKVRFVLDEREDEP